MKTLNAFSLAVATLLVAGSLVHAAETEQPAAAPPLTLREVTIDPLGADPDTPWFVHSKRLNIRNTPSIHHSEIIGALTEGDRVRGAYQLVLERDEEWLEIPFGDQKGYISRLGFSRIHPKNAALIKEHGNLPFGSEIVNRWWGIPLDYEADDLVELPSEVTRQSEGRRYRLREEAAEKLVEMVEAMRADGLAVFVLSPYRSGASQASIYRRRMERNGLNQRRSAPPGHSEHQLGTTVDLAPELTGRTLRNTDPQHAWLTENAAKFGWRQTYRAENIEETGYIEEPWHWRYVGTENLEHSAP